MMNRIIAGVLLAFACSPVLAEWVLDHEESRISYVTTKANTAAEVNHFRKIGGVISSDGAATLRIDLNSVDTAIEIRNERVREFLFETTEFPTAQVTATIDLQQVNSQATDSLSVVVAEAVLNLHGMDVSLTFEAIVAKIDPDTLLVTSARPVIVNAAQFGLLDGIEKLRTIAGLPSISPAVPVSFVLKWTRE